MTKTNVIVQCRFSSNRLPGKALYPLGGMPVLDFLLKRLKQSLPDTHFQLIVATSSNKEDDIIASWAKEESVATVRGSLNDVLLRYLMALDQFPSPINVRVTADNPLTCPRILQDCVQLLKKGKLDYVMSQEFPYGAGVDVFSDSLLRQMDEQTKDRYDREHINNFVFKNPNDFKTGILTAKGHLSRPDLSLTIDNLDDFNTMVNIVNFHKSQSPWAMSIEDAIACLDLFKKA